MEEKKATTQHLQEPNMTTCDKLCDADKYDEEQPPPPCLPEEDESQEERMEDNIFSLLRSYLQSYDFLELLLCLSSFLPSIILDHLHVEPHQRPIPAEQVESTGDHVINQMFGHAAVENQTVTSKQLLLYAVVIPMVLQCLLAFLPRTKRGNLHKTICVYVTALAVTAICSQLLKLYVGYLRPIFMEVCQPGQDFEDCTNDAKAVRQVRLSFPSGHSSTAFCGLSLLSFYLEHHFGVSALKTLIVLPDSNFAGLAYKQPVKLRRLVSLFCYAPMLVAGWIAASRVHDNRHHPADVIAGALLGFGAASLVYSLWFPTWPCAQQHVDETNPTKPTSQSPCQIFSTAKEPSS